ncbi:MAG: TIGR03032 family protein, partial [Gammaproteobacteria bacterium]|nr:TIGR03032 family protein [Gammaproteobacteria bacterium]
IAADRTRLAIATRYQIWFLHNEAILAPKIEPKDTYDACYIPRTSHVTSNIDIHEIAWGGDELWCVNTLFSCLCTIDSDFSFVPRWKPPFISKLARHDRCHLNGLAMVNGAPGYVTMFGQTDSPQGWRENKDGGGVVMHVGSGEVVAQDLSMPHSPRWYRDRLWVLDSGNGALLAIDADGRKDPVARFNGYTRGLAFCGGYAFVGLSKIREQEIFGGVPIAGDERVRHCGIGIVDIASGNIVGQLEFETSVEEIFDVQILPGIRYPTVVGFAQDTIERASTMPPIDTARNIGSDSGHVSQQVLKQAVECNRRGLQFVKDKRFQQAADEFRQALSLNPNYAKALNNLGYVLIELEQADDAIDYCRRALSVEPDYAAANNNLGNALRQQGNFEEALRHYDAALRSNTEYMLAYYNKGCTLSSLGRGDEAITNFERALTLDSNSLATYTALGNVYRDQGRIQEAIAAFDDALNIDPEDVNTLNDKGLALQANSDVSASIECFNKALEVDPGHVVIHANRGYAWLKLGEFERGWREYEWRLKARPGPGPDTKTNARTEHKPWAAEIDMRSRCRQFKQDAWDGSPLEDRSILIWGEQGIGDEFMFASMIPDVMDQAGHCTIECDHRSVELFQRSFQDSEVFGKSDPPDPRALAEDIDVQCAMGSLGRWLRPGPASFATGKQTYLIADKHKTAALRKEYRKSQKKLLVGIAWRSGNAKFGLMRSARLSHWDELFEQPNIGFVNLQYGDCAAELAEVKSRLGVDVTQDGTVDPLQDLDAFAAQVSALDLIISIDNSTVHIAGALGKPVWTLLSFSADWRWMLNRDDSLWYPTMRLFRQQARNDWDGVFRQVADELRLFVERTKE